MRTPDPVPPRKPETVVDDYADDYEQKSLIAVSALGASAQDHLLRYAIGKNLSRDVTVVFETEHDVKLVQQWYPEFNELEHLHLISFAQSLELGFSLEQATMPPKVEGGRLRVVIYTSEAYAKMVKNIHNMTSPVETGEETPVNRADVILKRKFTLSGTMTANEKFRRTYDSLRQTGRTSRMLRLALELISQDKQVKVLFYSDFERRHYLTQYPGLKDVQGLEFDIYNIRNMGRSDIDWANMTLVDAPNTVLLVDHGALEVHFKHMLMQLHAYDSEEQVLSLRQVPELFPDHKLSAVPYYSFAHLHIPK